MNALPLIWRKIPERYGLIGSCCESCGEYFFPVRRVCPRCRRKGKIHSAPLSRRGRVFSYTVVHSAPAGFELEVPYILAIVELENGAKLTTQIVDAEPEHVRIGTPVEVAFRKIQESGAEGVIWYGYKFRPAPDEKK